MAAPTIGQAKQVLETLWKYLPPQARASLLGSLTDLLAGKPTMAERKFRITSQTTAIVLAAHGGKKK